MKIKELRQKLGMTQAQFAEYFGIPITNVAHWEQGVSSPPSYVTKMIERIIDLEESIDET